MKLRLTNIQVMMGSLLLPALAQAATEAHGEHHAIDWIKEVAFPYANLLILLSVLFFLLRKPLKEFLLARSKNIAQSIEEGAREKHQEEAKLLNYEKKLNNIESEMNALVDSLKKEGELLQARILEDAKINSQRIEETARLMGSQEVLKAKEKLKEEAVRLSSEWAEKFIRENLKNEDREKMMNESIQKLEALS